MFYIFENGTQKYTASVTVPSGGSVNAGTFGTATVSAKSGVMLQGFNWSSADRANLTSTQNKWYTVMQGRANDIKDTFEYVWFPPPSKCPSFSPEGYIPTELNDLNSYYGTSAQLTATIAAIQPAKAIADIVVNHRGGFSSWGDFKNPQWTEDYYSICSGDEGFTNSGSDPMNGSTKKGAADTGENYADARDLDHTNTAVQNGIISWMNNYLKTIGFVGWRYDFVKGFGGTYVGQYNTATSAEFSVGEFWPTNTYEYSNSSNWSNQIVNWINATSNNGVKSRAFDFVLKGNFQTAFSDTRYDLLADSNAIFRRLPAQAVTFVDNHDTGSTQSHWPVPTSHVGKAYVFILTHPGYPTVAWQHYFTAAECGVSSYGTSADIAQYMGGTTVSGTSKTHRQHIDYLIELRKELGIEYDSSISVLSSTTTCYAAKITGANGELVVKLGPSTSYSPTGDGYTGNNPVYSGNDFAIWVKGEDGDDNGGGDNPTTVTLKMTKDVGFGNALYFTGSYNEGSNWTVATRGTYDDAGYWHVTVTPPSGGNFEWKVLKGTYDLGTSVNSPFSGMTWESGTTNHDQSNLHPSFNGGF
ncbi:hypothetical protein K7I13_04835 [Brucepastera parasyntrophica]|uniref:alpha-amylase C-terminal beta-sheet domain-containing protein n=1 Tax=Brucepastera parasyntrophica TaxID=2880008 RepID=UPI00210A4414|nr:alpha-amylase family glycosyl hydrolase [Brucepastera parasyntrophica]ULQ60609.1 hypothetical protein K7I13_04835 [Brucepastera parasyntrophica]